MKPSVTILVALLALWTKLSSQTWDQVQTAIISGGGEASSTSFTSKSSTGQASIGVNGSATFSQTFGTWSQYDALLHLYSFGYSVGSGWNAVSVPLTTQDYRATILYPTATSTAFNYVGGYVEQDTLSNGIGYWLKFGNSQTAYITGVPRSSESILVQKGWNLIGSVAGHVDVDVIQQSPSGIVVSRYYAYEGAYYVADTISSGRAYWVKAGAAGRLVLVAGAAPSATTPKQNQETLDVLHSIIISPGRGYEGRSTELRFGLEEEVNWDLDLYELPPPPPRHGLDIRFVSNRSIALLKKGKLEKIGISMSGNDVPMRMSWRIRPGSAVSYLLVEEFDGLVIDHHPLTGDGSIIVPAASKNTFSIVLHHLPADYALMQNYPNPFNPRTTFKFAVPTSGIVRLTIHDLLGRRVTTVVDEDLAAGEYSRSWDATGFASGVYYFRLQAGSFTETRKLILLK